MEHLSNKKYTPTSAEVHMHIMMHVFYTGVILTTKESRDQLIAAKS